MADDRADRDFAPGAAAPARYGDAQRSIETRPAGRVPSLVGITRDAQLDPSARHAAIGIARFASDRPDVARSDCRSGNRRGGGGGTRRMPRRFCRGQGQPPGKQQASRSCPFVRSCRPSTISKPPTTPASIDAPTPLRDGRLGDPEPTLTALRAAARTRHYAWLIELLGAPWAFRLTRRAQAKAATDSGVCDSAAPGDWPGTSDLNARGEDLRVHTQIVKVYHDDPDASVHWARLVARRRT